MVPWTHIGLQALNFAVFAGLLYRAARGRVSAYLQARRQRVEEELNEARRMRAEAERLKEEWERRLSSLREEREELLRREVERAEREAERILEEARRTAEREAAGLRERLLDELMRRSISLAEDSLRRTLKPADHRRLLEEYLVNMEGLLRC